MAANYWASTQRRHWQFSRESLSEVRQQLEDEEKTIVQQYPLPDRRLLSIFFNQRKHCITGVKQCLTFTELVKLGKRLHVRQQALATAQIYVRRFYIRVEIRRTNPYLVLATALYLACKMEESPQHIRSVVTEARTIWPGSSISSSHAESLLTHIKQSTSPRMSPNWVNMSSISFRR